MYRKTWMEVNLDDIVYNVQEAARISGKRIIAVLKADAYGCGDRYVLKAVLDGGAEMIAVSSLDEAMILRNEGYEGGILILGATDPEDADVMVREKISCAGFSMEWARKVAEKDCVGLKVHLKIDTGMNRIGFRDLDELSEAFDLLYGAGCEMEGIFTHFYCADSDPSITEKQFSRFKEAVESLHYPFAWIHCDNSDATVSFKDDLSNACRFGISLYGPSTYCDHLKYPVSLYSEVVMVKQIHAGDTVGYGATYTAAGDEWVATLPIGYADGLIRANSGRNIWIAGQYVPIVGRVCMDQIMVRLDEPVPVGTKAEIFGEHISINDMAKDLHTIPYEILCLISPRVTRRYLRSGEEMIENSRIRNSEQ